MEKLVKRLEKYLQENQISNYKAEKDLELGNGSLAKIFKRGTGLKSDILEKIEIKYPDFFSYHQKNKFEKVEEPKTEYISSINTLEQKKTEELINSNVHYRELINRQLNIIEQLTGIQSKAASA